MSDTSEDLGQSRRRENHSPTGTFRVSEAAWFGTDRPEDLLPGILRPPEPICWKDSDESDAPSTLETRFADACFDRSDAESLASLLRPLRWKERMRAESWDRGGIVTIEAFALPDGSVALLSEFEPSGPRRTLRIQVLPVLFSLAQDWDREVGRIEAEYHAASKKDAKAAEQAKYEARGALRESYAQRLLAELPSAVWLDDSPLDDSNLRAGANRWKEPAELRKVAEKVLSNAGAPFAADGRYDVTLLLRRTSAEAGPGLLVAYTPRLVTSPVMEWVSAGRTLVPEAFRHPLLVDAAPPSFAEPGEAVSAGADQMLPPLDLLESNDPIQEAAQRVGEAIRQRGLEALGWYQSCHTFDEGSWGIYLHLPNIRDLTLALLERLHTAGHLGGLKDAFEVISLLVVEHEFFHARVDFFGLDKEFVVRKPLALPYQEHVYKKTCASLGALEEALANFVGYQAVQQFLAGQKAQKRWEDRAAAVALAFVEEQLDLGPVGYRDWRGGHDTLSWRRLVAQVLTGQVETAGSLPPLEESLRQMSPPITRRADVPFWWWVTDPAIADRLFGTPLPGARLNGSSIAGAMFRTRKEGMEVTFYGSRPMGVLFPFHAAGSSAIRFSRAFSTISGSARANTWHFGRGCKHRPVPVLDHSASNRYASNRSAFR